MTLQKTLNIQLGKMALKNIKINALKKYQVLLYIIIYFYHLLVYFSKRILVNIININYLINY